MLSRMRPCTRVMPKFDQTQSHPLQLIWPNSLMSVLSGYGAAASSRCAVPGGGALATRGTRVSVKRYFGFCSTNHSAPQILSRNVTKQVFIRGMASAEPVSHHLYTFCIIIFILRRSQFRMPSIALRAKGGFCIGIPNIAGLQSTCRV